MNSSPQASPLDPEEIEGLLRRWQTGDVEARDQLLAVVYPQLKGLARRLLRAEATGHTLDTTALVHEACLGLLGRDAPEWQGRAPFFAFMATVMRHVLVDYARRRTSAKRGGTQVRVPLREDLVAKDEDAAEVLALDDILSRLAAFSPRMAQIVECRCFAGMTDAEIGSALGISVRTVAREWQRARAWLRVAWESAPPT